MLKPPVTPTRNGRRYRRGGLTLEDVRLDAAERERRLKQAAVEADLARVQNDQLQRIHEAEKKANADLEKILWRSGREPRPVVGRSRPARAKGRSGPHRLRRKPNQVQSSRLTDGSTKILLIRDQKQVSIEGTQSAFTCGPQEPPRKVSINYSAHPDKRPAAMATSSPCTSTDGRYASIHVRNRSHHSTGPTGGRRRLSTASKGVASHSLIGTNRAFCVTTAGRLSWMASSRVSWCHGCVLPTSDAAGEREILNVAVDLPTGGKGLGERLLRAELERGGIHFLEVRESNARRPAGFTRNRVSGKWRCARSTTMLRRKMQS